MTEQPQAPSVIHACIDRYPLGVPVSSALEAIAAPLSDRIPELTPTPESAVFLFRKKWQTGQTITVYFMDGQESVQERVKPYAHLWSRYANIRFKFVDDPNADIRISFNERGSWSYLGTDARFIPKDQPTMNFGWLRPATEASEYNRVVVHEFGHALGLAHEHQNPDNGIPWNKPVVYEYYGGPPNNWSKEQVDVNLFQQYDDDQVQYSAFDSDSIMLYPVPNEFTIGDFEIGWNTGLSETDKSFISRMYPKPANELIVDAPPRVEAISSFGEVDTFTFLVSEAGTFRIETEGRTDLVMMLYGPEDDTELIAMDDDSGRRLNPRIVEALEWGEYTVRIQHFSKQRLGDYAIGVYTADADATQN